MFKNPRYKMQKLKERLLFEGYSLSEKTRWCFFKQLSKNAVFVVFLERNDKAIDALYGCMAKDVGYFNKEPTVQCQNGYELFAGEDSDDTVNVRKRAQITSDEDFEPFMQELSSFYKEFKGVEAKELLEIEEAARREFFEAIDFTLKPLGFKKEDTVWSCPLENGIYIQLSLRVPYGTDSGYYIYLEINSTENKGFLNCYKTRLMLNGNKDVIDFQTVSRAELNEFIGKEILPKITYFLRTPLEELGQKEDVWKHCICKGDICKKCWVQESLWTISKLKKS